MAKDPPAPRGMPAVLLTLLVLAVVAWFSGGKRMLVRQQQQQQLVAPYVDVDEPRGEPQGERERYLRPQAHRKEPEWAAAADAWGPVVTPGSSSRGGRYLVTTVMGLDPERLAVCVHSLRRHAPATQLVVFLERGSEHPLLEASGAQVIPFSMDDATENKALVLYRWVRMG